ncbi:MAG: class I SAM-dependent methyltransferase [Alphaproteobacteria bacterium]|nr:class I SAM-dependent methyltransferase [Alphaproteobacteria bacterium]
MPRPHGTQNTPPATGTGAPLRLTQRDLSELKATPLLFQVAARLAAHVREGAIVFRLPDGRWFRFDGPAPGPEGVLLVQDYAFARRLAFGGGIGFAEAYLRGEWDSPDVARFLEVIARNAEPMERYFLGNPVVNFANRCVHALRANTRTGARKNISFHYDLGNAFYEKWLDPGMTYSSARFQAPDQDLAEAQTVKYAELARRIAIAPESRVLEIGCGWGGFASFAAREIGCSVTGITISREQYDFSRKRIFEEGLADRVDIQFRDYRDVEGRYDRIASIEMFEAVGEAYWPSFFDKLREVLVEGGRAGLQIITIADRHFPTYRSSSDFIRHYVFPGGMLPSPGILKAEARRVGLAWAGAVDFGLDYAATLRRWRDRFLEAWPQIEPLGFDERFRRIWTYYLSYCEAGFRAGNIDVSQIALARG